MDTLEYAIVLFSLFLSTLNTLLLFYIFKNIFLIINTIQLLTMNNVSEYENEKDI